MNKLHKVDDIIKGRELQLEAELTEKNQLHKLPSLKRNLRNRVLTMAGISEEEYESFAGNSNKPVLIKEASEEARTEILSELERRQEAKRAETFKKNMEYIAEKEMENFEEEELREKITKEQMKAERLREEQEAKTRKQKRKEIDKEYHDTCEKVEKAMNNDEMDFEEGAKLIDKAYEDYSNKIDKLEDYEIKIV